MFKPFEEKPRPYIETVFDWDEIYAKPYDKMTIDPYTKARIILMNGIHVEAVMFGHNFHRNCDDNDVRRALAKTRRGEQQEQKRINWLSPGDESQLEQTIGYEHLAVDLTAWLAMHEPDEYVKACLDFALLEDFDHLYRYANLLDLDKDIPSRKLVKDYVEITPGRPTIAHHRHPHDSVKRQCDFKTAHIQTKLNTLIITSGEQQTMNFYMNIGPTYEDDPGRKLYQEIGMVEEQHVTHYGALLDPECSWFENLLLREYMQCYLYYSFLTDEPDKAIRKIWEQHLVVELSHLHAAKDLFEKYEDRQWEEVVPAEFPTLIRFKQTKEYVRDILENTVENTASREDFVSIEDIPEDHEFYRYQAAVNKSADMVTSHRVIESYQDHSRDGRDYRFEESPNPVPELADRTSDNTSLGRLPKDRWEDEEDDDSMSPAAEAGVDIEEDVDDMNLEESVAIASGDEPMDEADAVDEMMDDNDSDHDAEDEDIVSEDEGVVRPSRGDVIDAEFEEIGVDDEDADAVKKPSSYRPGKRTVSRIKEEIKEEILEELRDEIAGSRSDDDGEEDDADETFYDPGQTAPYSGIYAMVDSSGEPTGSERTVVKGEPFPPSGKSGQSYKLARAAKNAAGKM